jgi:hypothetical protein
LVADQQVNGIDERPDQSWWLLGTLIRVGSIFHRTLGLHTRDDQGAGPDTAVGSSAPRSERVQAFPPAVVPNVEALDHRHSFAPNCST